MSTSDTRASPVSIPLETNSHVFFLSQPSKASSGRPKVHMTFGLPIRTPEIVMMKYTGAALVG